ncbi:hypothetical protein MNB_SUP05-SYMBIONT-4-396 [hydrothermal vent metagenome]|uniref:Uncharacterized protein n=1 Tax=hydrothermal vent metagenome TaxID=652676 RepID=A0A1W1DZY2_9ZZZZ
MNIKKYENKVIECLNAQQDDIILNSDINHAGILIKQIFLNAVHTVNLLSNKLDAQLYERVEIINAIRSFLNRGGKLNVAIEGDIDKKSTNMQKLLAEYKIQPTVVPGWLKKQYEYNFLTMDDTGYRFEGSREEHKASVNFGDKNQTEKLNAIFNKIVELVK